MSIKRGKLLLLCRKKTHTHTHCEYTIYCLFFFFVYDPNPRTFSHIDIKSISLISLHKYNLFITQDKYKNFNYILHSQMLRSTFLYCYKWTKWKEKKNCHRIQMKKWSRADTIILYIRDNFRTPTSDLNKNSK